MSVSSDKVAHCAVEMTTAFDYQSDQSTLPFQDGSSTIDMLVTKTTFVVPPLREETEVTDTMGITSFNEIPTTKQLTRIKSTTNKARTITSNTMSSRLIPPRETEDSTVLTPSSEKMTAQFMSVETKTTKTSNAMLPTTRTLYEPVSTYTTDEESSGSAPITTHIIPIGTAGMTVSTKKISTSDTTTSEVGVLDEGTTPNLGSTDQGNGILHVHVQCKLEKLSRKVVQCSLSYYSY